MAETALKKLVKYAIYVLALVISGTMVFLGFQGKSARTDAGFFVERAHADVPGQDTVEEEVWGDGGDGWPGVDGDDGGGGDNDDGGSM